MPAAAAIPTPPRHAGRRQRSTVDTSPCVHYRLHPGDAEQEEGKLGLQLGERDQPTGNRGQHVLNQRADIRNWPDHLRNRRRHVRNRRVREGCHWHWPEALAPNRLGPPPPSNRPATSLQVAGRPDFCAARPKPPRQSFSAAAAFLDLGRGAHRDAKSDRRLRRHPGPAGVCGRSCQRPCRLVPCGPHQTRSRRGWTSPS